MSNGWTAVCNTCHCCPCVCIRSFPFCMETETMQERERLALLQAAAVLFIEERTVDEAVTAAEKILAELKARGH